MPFILRLRGCLISGSIKIRHCPFRLKNSKWVDWTRWFFAVLAGRGCFPQCLRRAVPIYEWKVCRVCRSGGSTLLVSGECDRLKESSGKRTKEPGREGNLAIKSPKPRELNFESNKKQWYKKNSKKLKLKSQKKKSRELLEQNQIPQVSWNSFLGLRPLIITCLHSSGLLTTSKT